MARIMLVNSPIRTSEPPKHIPYGLAILAALADSTGHEVGILDVNAFRLNRELIRRDLKAEAADKPLDLIGVSGLVTTYGFQKEIIPWLRRDHPGAVIVAGGGCASSIPGEMLEWIPELDMVCIGEGEKTFMEILDHLEDRDFSKVKGIWYREDLEDWPRPSKKHARKVEKKAKEMVAARRRGEVGVVKNPIRPLMSEEELDQLPYPAWELLPMEEVYFKNSPLALSAEALAAKRRIDLISERGCPYSCTFCFHNYMGGDRLPDGSRLKPLVRYQSARYAVGLIKYARIKMGIDFVSILDENFLANRKRALEFCDLMEEEELVGVVKWGCLGGPQTVDPELLARLREAGCTYISFGFESADPRRLKEIKKPHTVEQMSNALRWTIKSGINPITTFMVGYPEEDLVSIYETARFWVKNGIECVPFFITPYPGTELFKKHREAILRQHGGDMERFVLALGDATKLVANLTRFSDPEILGLRDLMVSHDLERIRRFAAKRGVELEEESLRLESMVSTSSAEGSMGEIGEMET
ncbi:MAG: B12-binding domain-containing radical SAM protein [Deltaproteobacteria bacterium]|nr:B12-binding domain-containing radical SAM protein [Deltaproteobacteria bacterium]